MSEAEKELQKKTEDLAAKGDDSSQARAELESEEKREAHARNRNQ